MGIEWFGPAAQKALVDEGLLNSIPDIYNITEDEYKRVVGSAMGSKIYLSIQARKVAEWSKVLGSLGVKHLGDKVSRELAKRWKSIDEIIEKLESTSIVGMGTIKKRIVEELERRKHEIYFLVSKVNIVEVEEKPKGTKGSFCVTGTLSKPRKEIHKLIEAEGGNVTASVSKGLDYLVAGEKAGSKLEKAKKLGIKVLSEQELISMME
jgi:DNA ligase (NAD+)